MKPFARPLAASVPELIRRGEPKLGVDVAGFFLQRMTTEWGSCNPRARTIRLNIELVKKPKDLLEYVVVHEMLHLIEPTHSERFLTLMSVKEGNGSATRRQPFLAGECITAPLRARPRSSLP